MNTEALLARLRADERHDAAVLRMGEEVPADAADRLGLAEGVLFRMEELGG